MEVSRNRQTMDEKQKSKNRSLSDIEISEGFLLVVAFAGGLLVVALIILLLVNIRERSIFATVVTISLMILLFQSVGWGLKGVERGYNLLLKSLRARQDEKRPIQPSIFSPPTPTTYILGDDGEIMEVVEDGKRKRDTDSTVE
jgi:hypothetical protein